MHPYPLRLPSYRSSHGRRYHPYPTARRHANNDEFYMDPVRDFDFEAAEHVLELPPSIELRAARRGDNDDDVAALELGRSASQEVKSDKGGDLRDYVAVEDHGNVNLKVATVRQPRLSKLYAVFLVLQYVRDHVVKGKLNIARNAVEK